MVPQWRSWRRSRKCPECVYLRVFRDLNNFRSGKAMGPAGFQPGHMMWLNWLDVHDCMSERLRRITLQTRWMRRRSTNGLKCKGCTGIAVDPGWVRPPAPSIADVGLFRRTLRTAPPGLYVVANPWPSRGRPRPQRPPLRASVVAEKPYPPSECHFQIISFMISEVPPPIGISLASRYARAMSYSSMNP